LYTILHTYWLHGAESFLIKTNWFPASQEIPPFYGTQSFITPFTSACYLSLSWAHISGSIQVRGTSLYFITCLIFYGEQFSPHPKPRLDYYPCWLSATSYSIYSPPPSILEAVPPSATWGHAMLWWQGPTYLGCIA
jgi:hypothetical protein